MHFITMHNSILPEFSVVLIGITLPFSELGVLPQTLEPRRVWTAISLQGKFTLAHVLLDYVYQSKCKILWFIIAWKRKTYFRMMWIAIYIVGWQMEPWYDVVGGGSICTGKYYLGFNNQCRQCSCAVNEALTMRLGMGRESHLWSFPFRMSTDCQFLTL